LNITKFLFTTENRQVGLGISKLITKKGKSIAEQHFFLLSSST